MADYRLAAVGREAEEDERLSLLELLYDPTTRRRRAIVQPGWRCLEVGAGRGSMAVWLAEQVGPTGRVIATDVDTAYLRRINLPNLEILEHNILEDSLEALEPGSFDLVCSRSSAGDTSRVTVDNDAASTGSSPVEANVYRRM
jgi:2-polyprenyl-3-methyl-5-hydroxy-6-metoxy-1,4-benzoquinol methylase